MTGLSWLSSASLKNSTGCHAQRYATREDLLLIAPGLGRRVWSRSVMATLLEKGNEIEAPKLGLQGAMPAIDRLACFARELASFASSRRPLFSQNEIVAGS